MHGGFTGGPRRYPQGQRGVTMLILIFLALCAIGGFPWWSYLLGIAVWLFASDWSN